MGMTPDEMLRAWIKGAGQNPDLLKNEDPLRKKIVLAGEFLYKTCRVSPDKVPGYLGGFNFRAPVSVVSLPTDRLYVQYVSRHLGNWFSDAGVGMDKLGIVAAKRVPRFFRPKGKVVALKGIASSVTVTWDADRKLLHADLGKAMRAIEHAKRKFEKNDPADKLSNDELQILRAYEIFKADMKADEADAAKRKAAAQKLAAELKAISAFIGQPEIGGGTQYFVHDKSQMARV